MGGQLTIEPRAGGQVRPHYPQGIVAVGHIVEIDPLRRVVFRRPGQRSPGWFDDRHVNLTPVADGTRVILRHRDFPNTDMLWGAAQGWR
jgi:hypothetical protein